MLSKSQKSLQTGLVAHSAQPIHALTVRNKHDTLLYQRGRTYKKISHVLTYIILIIGAFFILLPFAWLISASLKNTTQYYVAPIQWIPNPFVWSNYVETFTQYNFMTYVGNSLFLAVFAMIVNTISSSLAAFGFARFRFPGRNIWFIIMLSTLMLPAQVLTIPLYVTFKTFGWIDTFLPIMVPQLFGSAFNIFLCRQFFADLPRELDEAARIDGCSNLRIWWNIILPQSRPVLIVVAIFTFLSSWRDAW